MKDKSTISPFRIISLCLLLISIFMILSPGPEGKPSNWQGVVLLVLGALYLVSPQLILIGVLFKLKTTSAIKKMFIMCIIVFFVSLYFQFWAQVGGQFIKGFYVIFMFPIMIFVYLLMR